MSTTRELWRAEGFNVRHSKSLLWWDRTEENTLAWQFYFIYLFFSGLFFFFFGCTPKPSAVRAGVLITELPGNSQECFYTFTSFINVLLDEQILSSAFSQLQHGWLKFMKIMSSHTYILLENVKPFHIMVNNLS